MATAQATHHPELQSNVVAVGYNFERRLGQLHMAENHCADMAGAIEFFSRIDPAVKTILTYAGGVDDTAFHRRGEEWVAA